MNPKKLLHITLWLSIAMVFFVVFVYVLNFRDFSISKSSQNWGTFGDYFGGMLNPLIGILNLVILIFITFQIAHAESDRARSELEIQKEIALYSLRHDALKEFNQVLEKVQPELGALKKDSALKIIFLRNHLYALINSYNYLFPILEGMDCQPLLESFETISKFADRVLDNDTTLDIAKEVMPELNRFMSHKTAFVVQLQKEILGKVETSS